MKTKKILGASLGNCVHVGGVVHFLNLAQDLGYETVFAGPAIPPDKIIALCRTQQPKYVALGYRLTPENALPLVEALRAGAETLPYKPVWLFGGTPPVAEVVRETGFFDFVFDGYEDIDDCIAFLRNTQRAVSADTYAQTLVARLAQKAPYPLLRHHFGLPSYAETVAGCRAIAESKVLDVISLGIDQNTQQFYFHPDERDPALNGAGGVPVHNDDEFRALKAASQCGNYPLMRCYSGTADVLRFAEVLSATLDNAWCAVPLFWYNKLDGRGDRTLEESMAEAQQLIAWHAGRDIPVELNEPHHWGLRDAHDVLSVAASFLSAYHAKKLGVRHYIAQYMFNVPNTLSFSMDLAKVLAQIEITEALQSDDFTCYRQTRTGLPFLSPDLMLAKGQLASSTMLQMAVKPDIIHVVGYSEAVHAATPDIVIESTKIVRGAVRSSLDGSADMTWDPRVQERKRELLDEAACLLDFIRARYRGVSDDPLFDPKILADCVRCGILDAPHLVKNADCRGNLQTRMIDGKCLAYNEDTNKPMSEAERLQRLEDAGLLNPDAICPSA